MAAAENAETILHAITPASLRAHADWIGNGPLPAAEHLRREAARLEAESARETSVETLARALAENFTESTRWDWLTVSRAAHAFFAADGRLLPEGGTDCEDERGDTEWREEIARKWTDASEAVRRSEHHFPADCRAEAVEMLNRGALTPPAVSVLEGGTVLTAAEADDVRTFMRWAAGRNNGMAHPDEAAYRIRVKFGLYDSSVPAPPAEPVPDSGPDGTPEKPWPTWQDVPEGAVYQSHLSGAHWRYGNRCGLPYAFGENAVVAGGYLNQHLAPFVRVDGDKA
ncbi:hypothetical protein GS888_24605 [Rhodococcus hoagii]|nr:hypothetical protein [Prescottella equi]